MLNVIQQETRQIGNIIYIGHSLGTTMGMIYGSEYPEEAKRTVKLFIWISPSHKLTNMLSPYRVLAPFTSTILVSFHFKTKICRIYNLSSFVTTLPTDYLYSKSNKKYIKCEQNSKNLHRKSYIYTLRRCICKNLRLYI